MNKETEKQMVDVLTGKLKLKLSVKPTPTSQYVDRLIEANHRDRAKMTPTERTASILRGCG
jgi:hypothetical protein